jgi:tellurite resistance protein TehA-like permease
VTLFVWSAATFWLPFLVGMTLWRYVVRRDRFRYDPGLWGMVFPLGMYSACTFALARAEKLAFLEPLSQAFAFIALAAWLLVAVVFVEGLSRKFRWRTSHTD